jgi:hypothetical protein
MGLREYAAQQQQQTEAQPAHAPKVQPAAVREIPDELLPAGYADIYREVIAFHARHIPPPGSDKEWIAAAEDIGQTSAGLKNNPLAMDLLAAVYEEIGRKWKQQGQQLRIELDT